MPSLPFHLPLSCFCVYPLECILSSPKWFYKKTHKPLLCALKHGGPGSQSELLWVTRMLCCFVKLVDILRTEHLNLIYNSQKQEAAWQNSFHKKGLYKKCIHRAWFLSLENSPQWKYELKSWPHNSLRKKSKRNLLGKYLPWPHATDYRMYGVAQAALFINIWTMPVFATSKTYSLSIRFWQERQRERRISENGSKDRWEGD